MNSVDSIETLRFSASSRAVAIEILVHGAQSRSRLAARMGLSAATLTRVVKPLLEAGVLVEEGAVRGSLRGRYSLPLDVVPHNYRFAGVKLTTDAIYAVVTDLRARILEKEVVDLPSLAVPDVVRAVVAVVERLQARSDAPLDSVGVTVGGKVDAGEIVADSSFLHWNDVPFRSLLAQELSVPVYLDNDVVGLTKAQHWFGHGREYESFALLTVGAGIGYGLVVNHELMPTSIGLVAHYPVNEFGPLCPLGHRGCVSAYLSSGSISTAVSVGHGRGVRYEEVLDLAAQGDPVASRVLDEAARALGKTTAAITALTGVERIILSGEGVHLADVARASLEAGLREYAPDHVSHAYPVIRPMDFLEWARGAAVIAIQEEFPPPSGWSSSRNSPPSLSDASIPLSGRGSADGGPVLAESSSAT